MAGPWARRGLVLYGARGKQSHLAQPHGEPTEDEEYEDKACRLCYQVGLEEAVLPWKSARTECFRSAGRQLKKFFGSSCSRCHRLRPWGQVKGLGRCLADTAHCF